MRVYTFATGAADGRGDMAAVLGGKGAHLAEMCRIGLPVPPGFTLPTSLCRQVLDGELGEDAGALDELLAEGIAHIERHMGRASGDATAPLLVSVRSGRRSRCRDDGHGPRPRLHRRRQERARGRGPRCASASRGGASSRCTRTWCSGSRASRIASRPRSTR